jgi:hypothetical protein
MWHAGLAIQDSAKVPQFTHHLTLVLALPGVVCLALEGADPAYVAHTRLDILDMELVLERDWHAMQRPFWLPVLREVGVQGLRVRNGRIKERLMQTVELDHLSFMVSNKRNGLTSW